MSNGEVCCILGVCCPPGSPQQLVALAHEVHKQRPHFSEDQAEAAALRILNEHHHFDDLVALIDQA